MKIVCDNKIPFLRGVFEPYAQVIYLPGRETDAEVVRDADALITRTRTRCSRELLEGSSVKVIATATIGFDHIDTHWCEENGIVWRNAPGCNSSSVEQYICSVLANLARKYGLQFGAMTLGVVGVGNVGSKVARAARILGMKVLLCDTPRAEAEGPQGFVSLDELIAGSDVVTLHVPLAEDTYHLFDRKRLETMRADQILINSSRGEVVDNGALKRALLEHRLRTAVLDVWEGEPHVDLQLLELLEAGTPHIAGYSADGKAKGTTESVRTVARILGIKELENWSVPGMPAPECAAEFSLKPEGLQDLLCEAILHTYDVRRDCEALRSRPSDFEKLRGDYPVRREFPAFTLDLHDKSSEAAKRLEELGFNLK